MLLLMDELKGRKMLGLTDNNIKNPELKGNLKA